MKAEPTQFLENGRSINGCFPLFTAFGKASLGR